MFKKLLLIFLFLSTTNLVYSQITISSPVVRQIFQRDLNNQATVTITGSYSQPIDTIQVRFTPVKAGQGTAIDWTVIKSAPLGGLFKGSIVVKGGWYIMDVRGLLNGKLVGNISTLERVGVGEVFVIAGQSNAGGSGERGYNETGSTDDRVNCANFLNAPEGYWKQYDPTNSSFKITANSTNFSIVQFSQLTKNSSIGPIGLGVYYWGKVGDALSAKENVPVMFFNVAWAGSSSRVWRESAENPTIGAYSDVQPFLPTINRYDVGVPYSNMKGVLSYYGINLGVRAVLWMQGETENVLNIDDNTTNDVSALQYQKNLEYIIAKSRQDLGNSKLAWVVSRTSYSGALGCGTNPANKIQQPSPLIAVGQNETIRSNANVYPGPFTDNIQVPRVNIGKAECVHFTGTGLDDVAAAWIKALTEDNKNFFQTVEPILADTIPSVSLDCISSGVLKLSLPSGYAGYEWVNTGNNTIVGNTQSINVNSGSYVARVTRSNGNIIQVPQFTVKANTPPIAPSVKALSDVNFCLGTSVTLQSTTEADNPIYEWVSTPAITNLPRTKDIAATREGTYRLRVIDKNACASPYSTEVKLVAKPRPEKPFVATSGSTALCQGQTLTLTSTNVGASSYVWSGTDVSGEKGQSITVGKAGTYNVRTVGANGCLSPFSTDNITVIVNSLPTTPQIRALSDTVFCDGGNTLLVLTPADNKLKLGWNRNNGISKDTVSTIRVSGTELVKGFVVDTKGCQSLLSNAIQVVKKDNPQALSIVAKSTYSFVARASNKVDEYVWKLDGKILSAKDSLIKTVDKGTYTVLGKNIYKVKSSTIPLTCSSAESEKYDFNPYDDKGLSVYPNPSSGVFTLESRYDLDKVIISIWSMDGKALYKSDVINTFNSPRKIDVGSLSEGMYILKIESSTFKLTKFISIVR